MPARRASEFSAKRRAVSPELFFQSLISQATPGFCKPSSECQPEERQRQSVKFSNVEPASIMMDDAEECIPVVLDIGSRLAKVGSKTNPCICTSGSLCTAHVLCTCVYN